MIRGLSALGLGEEGLGRGREPQREKGTKRHARSMKTCREFQTNRNAKRCSCRLTSRGRNNPE